MKLEKGKFYKIIFNVNGRTLTFRCKITEDDGQFISFIDKFGVLLSYNKNTIISVEEVKGYE